MSNKDLVKVLTEENEQLMQENKYVESVKQQRDDNKKELDKYKSATIVMGIILFTIAVCAGAFFVYGGSGESEYDYSDIEEKEAETSGLRDEKTVLENQVSDLEEENTDLVTENENLVTDYSALEEDFDILLGCYENNYDYCEW